MKNADSSGRMPEFDINTKLAEKLDSDILEKFGFGSSSLTPKDQNSFREWMTTFLITKSPRMQEIIRIIEMISGANVSVLITGERGTGKGLVARTIHYSSKRREKPFVTLNCAALPEHLLDSELFGRVKGAHTGAVRDLAGCLAVADGGTLALDEVTELPLSIQKKLLFFLMEGTFKRVGGKNFVNADVRIIAVTSTDPKEEVKQGKLREDLFYRLNVVQINIPPLRERKDDIPLLVNHFIKKYNLGAGKDIQGISPNALKQLMNYDFPGNIRELESIIQKSIRLETSKTIQEVQIDIDPLREWVEMGINKRIINTGVKSPVEKIDSKKAIMDLKKTIEDMDKVLILRTLNETGGSKKAAADLLGISSRTLRLKLDRYGLLKTE